MIFPFRRFCAFTRHDRRGRAENQSRKREHQWSAFPERRIADMVTRTLPKDYELVRKGLPSPRLVCFSAPIFSQNNLLLLPALLAVGLFAFSQTSLAEETIAPALFDAGAALQFGPQPGGALNFVMKMPRRDAQFHFITKNLYGSDKLFTNYTAIDGTIGAQSSSEDAARAWRSSRRSIAAGAPQD